MESTETGVWPSGAKGAVAGEPDAPRFGRAGVMRQGRSARHADPACNPGKDRLRRLGLRLAGARLCRRFSGRGPARRAAARRRRHAGEPEACLRLVELLDLSVLLDGDAQVLV